MPYPTRPLSRRRVARVVAALFWMVAGSGLQAQATSADTIQLIRKFTGMRFKTATTEAKVGGGFFGLSPEFESVLGKHPEALRSARRMKPYSIMQLLGSLGVAVGAGLALKETLDQAEDPLGTQSTTTPLAVVAASGVVTLVGVFGGRHYLNQSIQTFNAGQRTGGGSDAASRFGGAQLGVGFSGAGGAPRASVGVIVPVR